MRPDPTLIGTVQDVAGTSVISVLRTGQCAGASASEPFESAQQVQVASGYGEDD
jgi:hypothetical protein